MEQPVRIVRYVDSIEHYGVRILYRKGTAKVLADYLSRPSDKLFPVVKEEEGINRSTGDLSLVRTEIGQQEMIKQPEQLNRVDLQCI